ncbi:hypothetical protein [Akkermansia sp.]|uniref:hypothetical protein n=1 Tax=Akkermansia sp. TaxID=1872421 RepID=UPI0025BCDD1D|nr:hypothetical protein [Akkermansia sp.]MCC8148780.1 hypothetical protein [Akkermansia sp.]
MGFPLFNSSTLHAVLCAFAVSIFPYIETAKAQDDAGHSGALEIKTKTESLSANFHLGKTNDEEADRKRTKIGIGETVTLTLTGKPKGDISKLKWEITSGEKYAKLRKKSNGSVETQLRANTDIKWPNGIPDKSTFDVTVTVTTSDGIVVPTTLTIALPTHFEAEHLNGGTPYRKISKFYVGATAVLLLTLQPTDVSFEHIKIIERDLGSKPAKHVLDSETGHTGNGVDKALHCNNQNRIRDRLLYSTREAFITDVIACPTEWLWKCSWRQHTKNGGPLKETEKDDMFQIQYKEQKFKYHKVKKNINGQERSYKAITISKFKCNVTRDQQDYENRFH